MSDAVKRAVAGRDLEVEAAGLVQRRRAGEGAGRCIERDPRRQRGSVRHRRRIGQAVTIHIGECARRNLERPVRSLRGRLIEDRRRDDRRVVDRRDGQGERVGDAMSAPSLAMTLRSRSPVKFCGGVPENVWVAASNASQARQSRSVSQESRNKSDCCPHPRTCRRNPEGPGRAPRTRSDRRSEPTRSGASFTGVTVSVNVSETASDPSLAVTVRSKYAGCVQRRRARESAGCGIECEPRGKRAIHRTCAAV